MLMYHILHCLVMDGHASLSLTSLSLLYRFVNVLYIWTLFLLLNTFCHDCARLVTLCHELLYFLGFVCIPSLCLLLMQPNTNSQSLTLKYPWPPFEFTRLLGCVRLGYDKLMYLMVRGLVMNDTPRYFDCGVTIITLR